MGEAGEVPKKLQKSYFDVVGLCCSSEIPLVDNILRQLDGVKDVSVIVASRTVIVVHDTLLVSQTHIVDALNQARLEANVKVYGEINHHKKWPSPYAIASGLLLLLSFLKFVYHPFQWLALGAVAAGIIPVILKGFAALRNFRIDINILVLVAVIGTVAMRDYLEAGTIVFLFTSAEWLESRASHKASAEMSALMSIAPQTAVIAETGEVVNVNDIKLNTIVAVKAGEVIPIDGVVVDGKSEVDERTLTGESFPVSKHEDSSVWAGTINLNGYISIKTTSLAEDCAVAKMAKLVEEAQNKKSRTQRFIDRCAQFYTPAVLAISIGFAVIPVVLHVHNRDHWFHLALVVLVSACPCALVLSTPVATFCALTKAAKSGLLIKGGDYLETLAKIRNLAFDKTGTITRGEFMVEDFRSLTEATSIETLLYWVSSIESKSSHPMAAALVQYGRSFSIEPKPEDVEDFQNFPGEGICGKIDGNDVFIGNRKIALRAGCETAPSIEGVTGEGKTMGYVFCGANPVGIVTLSDACRTGAREAIEALKSLKIKTAMLTGDSQAAAMHAQNQLGQALDVVHAELLPEDKAKIIKRLKEDAPTAMVGDGINDAPALATADIGISMGVSGSALATETGHVILMSNDIRKIPQAIMLARRAHRKVVANVILSITTKVAILALAFAGHPLVWAAVLTDTGTCLVVILNSMLLLRQSHEHEKKCCKSSAMRQIEGCKVLKTNSSHNHNCCPSKVGTEVYETEQGCGKVHGSKCQSSVPNSGLCGKGSAKKRCNVGHNCRGTAATHNQDHGHRHCCYESRPQNGSASQQRCVVNCHSNNFTSSVSLCGNGKLSNSTNRQVPLVHNDADAEQCGQMCNDHNHGLFSPISLSTRSDNMCTNAVQKQGTCAFGNHKEQDTVEHCDHGSCEMITGSEPHVITGKCGSLREKNKECHEMHCGGENHDIKEGLGKTSECRSHTDLKSHIHHHRRHPKIGSHCCHPLQPVIDIETGKDHADSGPIHTCTNLAKREIGGCCKSYMKECCGKHGHKGPALRGCLSEIVTEY
ncbi:putative inactive cadmium/zinc-transporting ATPase HMA3 isoform X2 [Rhodamnia argentea]|uniref:Inactive cadmium/zinc-transporting ATPase HMA3 isoform X2 n=1 Tax=Rhodamnia argentea TaxID=178133 RepID=A0ABM3HAN1_9MYRT|nr:putative inactive cadmium/zinc-transporting ATPase HMA3 isoform X2 [Rhodamnia argentea]